MIDQVILLNNEEETLNLGKHIAQACTDTAIIYLSGDLGTGKTTLSRGFLNALGYQGNVKSPTYTFVESYIIEHLTIYHFDLYRFNTPEELEFIGIRDYFVANTICLIEWPTKGIGVLPNPDIEISFFYQKTRRTASIKAISTLGCSLLTYI